MKTSNQLMIFHLSIPYSIEGIPPIKKITPYNMEFLYSLVQYAKPTGYILFFLLILAANFLTESLYC